MRNKLNEVHLDEPKSTHNYLRAGSISIGGGEIRLSLTGGGMDMFINSEYINGLSYTDADDIKEAAMADIQEIIDAYTTLVAARLHKFDLELMDKLKNTKGK